MSGNIKIALAGYGLVGRRHAAIINRSPFLTLAGVAEPNADNQLAAKETGAPIYDDIVSLLKAERPDGILLATPTPLHLKQGLECIAAGCPVLIEKPITENSSNARALIEAADAAGVPLLVGHHRRHNGMVQAAKSAISRSEIGDIRAVQATCWFYKPDHYFDVAPWRTKKGAGPISVNLVHDVDLLRHFCGEVETVRAISVPSRRGFENEDLATAVLSFASGAIATISVSDSIVAPWSWELTARENPAYPATNQSCYLIGGSEGSLSLPDLRVWKHDDAPDWWTPIAARNLTCGMEDPFAVQMAHFADVIEGRAEPLVSGLEGFRSLEVVEAIAWSSESGREVAVGSGGPTSGKI